MGNSIGEAFASGWKGIPLSIPHQREHGNGKKYFMERTAYDMRQDLLAPQSSLRDFLLYHRMQRIQGLRVKALALSYRHANMRCSESANATAGIMTTN